MNKLTRKYLGKILIALMLLAGFLTGCSDYGNLTSSSTDGMGAVPFAYPEFREINVDSDLVIGPFGSSILNAKEFGFIEIKSIRFESNDPVNAYESPYFCDQLSLESDYPGKIGLADCSTARFTAKQVKVSNLSKKVLRLRATVTGKIRYSITDQDNSEN
jgi:hypothetical protein